jgi:hypothetical protein
MERNIPSKDQLRNRAAQGHIITQEEVAAIQAAEADLTGFGAVKGGSAATAQSLHAKQQNFLAAANDVLRKPIQELTAEDASKLRKAEVCNDYM